MYENTYIINHNFNNVQTHLIKYKFHLSIVLSKSKVENQNLFSFQSISKSDIEKDIQDIGPIKAPKKNTSPTKILKITV